MIMCWENINRHVKFNKLKGIVLELEKLRNINQHLDLIAGAAWRRFLKPLASLLMMCIPLIQM